MLSLDEDYVKKRLRMGKECVKIVLNFAAFSPLPGYVRVGKLEAASWRRAGASVGWRKPA